MVVSFSAQKLSVPTQNFFQEIVVSGLMKSITGPSPRKTRGSGPLQDPPANLPGGVIDTEWNHADSDHKEKKREQKQKRKEERERKKAQRGHKTQGYDDIDRAEVVMEEETQTKDEVELVVDGTSKALRGAAHLDSN